MILIASSWSKETSTHIARPRLSVWRALERLCKNISDEQAERRDGEDWSVAKEYIRSVLHGLA